MLGYLKRTILGQPLATAAEKHERLGKFIGPRGLFVGRRFLRRLWHGRSPDGTHGRWYGRPVVVLPDHDRDLILVGIVASLLLANDPCLPLGRRLVYRGQRQPRYPPRPRRRRLTPHRLCPHRRREHRLRHCGPHLCLSGSPPMAGNICVLSVLGMTLANLRGLRESAKAFFTLPTYWFIGSLGIL